MAKKAQGKTKEVAGQPPPLPDDLMGAQRFSVHEAGPETFLVKDQRMNRVQVFEFICAELMDGMVEHAGFQDPPDLVDLCSVEGMPRLSQVAAWCRMNPDWKTMLAEAEKVAAARRVNEARGIARRAQGQPQAGGSKLAVDTLLWEAAKLDRKYAEKQIIEDGTAELAGASTDALVQQLVAAVLAQPEILKQLAPTIRQVLPAEALLRIEEAATEAMRATAITVEATA